MPGHRVLPLCLILAAVFNLPAQTTGRPTSENKRIDHMPQLGVMDVVSKSFKESDTSLYTDVLRTEVFKLSYFKIIDRGLMQQILSEHKLASAVSMEDSQLLSVGKFLAAEKLLICKMETVQETTVVNMRIIDVATALVDFSEIVYLQDKNKIFASIKDLVSQLGVHFRNSAVTAPEQREEILVQTWKKLGASPEDLEYLMKTKIDSKEYVEIRQYDITFKVSDYVEAHKMGSSLALIELFFQEGLTFPEIKEALFLGITDLRGYRESFKLKNLKFREYLDAYRNHINDPYEYMEFKKGYRRNYFLAGGGIVADSLPLATSDFSFFLLTAAWEHYLTDYQRSLYKVSTEVGFNFMSLILPSPYFQMNYYIGSHPFYAKASAGVLTEVFLGMHVGVFGRVGMEIGSEYEFNLLAVFWGTQPKVSYADFHTEKDDPDYVELKFPYFGAFILMKNVNMF